MVQQFKKYYIAALLSAFSAWCFLHPVLTYYYDMNPWKLFGMAMYCVPESQMASILFFDASSGGFREIPYPERVSEKKQAKQLRYLNLRSHTGSLFPPDLLAEHAFELHPKMTRVKILFNHWSYSLDNSRMTRNSDVYIYDRVISSTGEERVIRAVDV